MGGGTRMTYDEADKWAGKEAIVECQMESVRFGLGGSL